MPALLVDDAGARQGRDCTYMPDLRRGLTKRRLIEKVGGGTRGLAHPAKYRQRGLDAQPSST
jgi:hypothetical protein